jgi:hypothetical protein
MRNKDIIYVGNADAIETTKFFVYVQAVTGTMSGVGSDFNTIAYHGP